MSKDNEGLKTHIELNCNINTSIVHIFRVSGEELNLANKIEIEIVNISVEGIVFKTFFYLEEQMSFCFELPLSEESKIFLVAEIVETIEDVDNYIYKCKFLHLSSIEQQNIKEYLEKKDEKKEATSE